MNKFNIFEFLFVLISWLAIGAILVFVVWSFHAFYFDSCAAFKHGILSYGYLPGRCAQ